MAKQKMSPTLSKMRRSAKCLPETRGAGEWSGCATRPCPEVAKQWEPAGAEPTPQHHSMALDGSELSLPKKV